MADLAAQLDSIRLKHDVPGLQAMLFNTEGIVETVVAGFRKRDFPVRVSPEDLWQIGSCTKAMTAFLVGTYVHERVLQWHSPVASFFPEFADKIHPELRSITLGHLLSHRSGLAREFNREATFKGTIRERRQAAARLALTMPPATKVGDLTYSNIGYIVVGAALENSADQSWEKLMRERVFKPLKIITAGFGGAGTPRQLDQPWGHHEHGASYRINGKNASTPLMRGPCGSVHLSAADWAKFLIDQLRGGCGLSAHFPAEVYLAQQSPYSKDKEEYGYGWNICHRSWSGGKALTHGGTNGLTQAVCWLSPKHRFGILACTNQGGEKAFFACDEAVVLLLRRHQNVA